MAKKSKPLSVSASLREPEKQDAKPSLVPKLRFPEFLDAEGWDADGLGKVADFVNEKIPVERVALENYVSTENILADYGGVAIASKLPTTGSVTRYRPNDTLVSNIRPYLKKVWVADKEGGASNDVIVIRAKQRLLPQYFSCLLKNDAFIDYVMTGAKGVKMPRGDIGSMKAYPTLYPSIPEQQKIAECLSSVDELMAAQARKVDALKTHKKGLMQQLFPREGETQPRLRFPEFSTSWKVGIVDELASMLMGNAFRSTDFVESGTQVIRIGNLYQGELQLDRSPVYMTKLHAEENSRFIVEPLDLLMSMTGTVGKRDYGYVVQVPENCNPLLLNQRVMKVASKKNCDTGFLLQLLKDERVLDQLYSRPGGTKQANLSAQDVKGMKISYPQIEEQQRIADCLSSLDDLIAAQTQKLAALKTHKKALMQQLFPSPEEVQA